jgi:hypothetical protein
MCFIVFYCVLLRFIAFYVSIGVISTMYRVLLCLFCVFIVFYCVLVCFIALQQIMCIIKTMHIERYRVRGH